MLSSSFTSSALLFISISSSFALLLFPFSHCFPPFLSSFLPFSPLFLLSLPHLPPLSTTPQNTISPLITLLYTSLHNTSQNITSQHITRHHFTSLHNTSQHNTHILQEWVFVRWGVLLSNRQSPAGQARPRRESENTASGETGRVGWTSHHTNSAQNYSQRVSLFHFYLLYFMWCILLGFYDFFLFLSMFHSCDDT